MKIWIDGYEANSPERLGSSQVAFELLKHLEKLDRSSEYTILLPDPPLADLPKERAGWKYQILKLKKFWTKIALPLALYTTKVRPDLIFSPTHYIPRFSPVKTVATIFDLSFLHFPEMFKRRDRWQLVNGTKYSVQNADYILTISQFSKKDIIDNYHLPKERISVFYPGFDETLFKPINSPTLIEKTKKKYHLPSNYLIFIGTIQPRKNIARLIEAVSRIDNLTLVIVGKTVSEGRSGWMFEDILKKPAELGIEDRVIFTGFVPAADLPALISGAQAFILPSLWEGFGIPAVEAMAVGTPVIVSAVSSLPEVVGKAGLLVDPYSLDQIEQAIRTIVSDNKLRTKLRKLGLEQAGKFSWKKAAKVVRSTFDRLVKSP